MQCPKCGFRQPQASECRKCGIIIEKYKAAQQRKQQLHTASEMQAKGGRSSGLIFFAAVVGAILVGVGIYLKGGLIPGKQPVDLVGDGESNSGFAQITEESGAVPAQDYGASPASSDYRQASAEAEDGLAAQLAELWSVSNPIEAARNATVSIISPWGSGSGFFIDNAGTIITNRHVIQFDPNQLKRLEQQAASLKKQLDNERNNINLTKRQFVNIRDREVKNQVAENLRLREERYEKYYRVYEELANRIETIEQGDFLNDGRVVLIDGSEHRPTSLEISFDKDLAMLSISVYNSPYIRYAARAEYPEQGKTVYTIGSPSGLSHTITSGIISGYRKLKGDSFIQTDAPINPGNSGGPLINAAGKVLGVNTMIIRDTEGIGFAVPFSTVLAEFPGVDQSQ